MLRRSFIVMATLVAVLVNGVAAASSLPTKAADSTVAVVALLDGHASEDKNRSEGPGAIDSERVEHACCHAHQWLGAAMASRLAPNSCLLGRRLAPSAAWLGSEPAPILKPPSA